MKFFPMSDMSWKGVTDLNMARRTFYFISTEAFNRYFRQIRESPSLQVAKNRQDKHLLEMMYQFHVTCEHKDEVNNPLRSLPSTNVHNFCGNKYKYDFTI